MDFCIGVQRNGLRTHGIFDPQTEVFGELLLPYDLAYREGAVVVQNSTKLLTVYSTFLSKKMTYFTTVVWVMDRYGITGIKSSPLVLPAHISLQLCLASILIFINRR